MPVDYYPNKSVEELTTILGDLQGRLANGAVTGFSAAGVSESRQPGGAFDSEIQTLRVLYSLHLRAAGTDDADVWPNPYASRVTRTRARYV